MRQKHSIDLLFSLSLFTVFVICSFLVLLLQTGSYRTIIEDGDRMASIHTPLAYVASIIRSHDRTGSLQIQEIEDTAVLSAQDDDGMVTYIYQRGDSLMELQMIKGVTPQLEAGTPLFSIHQFDVVIDNNKIHLSLQDTYDQKQELTIRLHSQ